VADSKIAAMDLAQLQSVRDAHLSQSITREQVGELIDAVDLLADENQRLAQRVAWFERQLFGARSERRLPDAEQGTLGANFDEVPDDGPALQSRPVSGHVRTVKAKTPSFAADESHAFFDEGKIPVQTIEVPNDDAKGLNADQYEVIGEKVSYRLAQRPGSYVVLKYVRPVIKRCDTQAISCPPAPAGVIEGSRADVSLLAGIIVDKAVYHLPIYRQHQRMQAMGLKVSRQWPLQLFQKAADLLAPIAEVQLRRMLLDRVLAMDETPIKAGVQKPGKMKQAYLWPVYGQHDEVGFLFYPDRKAKNVVDALGLEAPPGRVLLTDGYAAYEQYAGKTGIRHAQCWSHARRKFFDARDYEPKRADHALEMIGKLYAVEDEITERGLTGDAKKALRQTKAALHVKEFFAWADEQVMAHAFLPSSPLLTALGYARDRAEGLQIYLDDPDVQIDTNHLERALRPVPMGRRNWLFCWTEAGAEDLAVIQTLMVTCRLQGVDPYTYLVDVLQRISVTPNRDIADLTPRLWKEKFAANPMRADLDQGLLEFKNAA
jgi:transposase